MGQSQEVAVPNNTQRIDWPDGWFIYEAGQVRGPYSTQEAFFRKTNETDSDNFIISRKGFTRWYPLKELAKLYNSNKHFSFAEGESLAEIENSLNKEVESLSTIKDKTQMQAAATFSSNMRATGIQQPSSLSDFQANEKNFISAAEKEENTSEFTDEVTHTRASPTTKSSQTKKNRHTKVLQTKVLGPQKKHASTKAAETDLKYHSRLQQIEKKSAKPVTAVTARKKNPKTELSYQHMLQQGRLRLGPLLNPGVEAFPKFIVSLGFQWGSWYKNTLNSVAHHVTGDHMENANKYFWLALMPIYHMVLTFRLAKLMRVMESQNGYKKTSPLIATMFSIFPPLAIFYLQNKLNSHWKLHVYFETSSKKTQQ